MNIIYISFSTDVTPDQCLAPFLDDLLGHGVHVVAVLLELPARGRPVVDEIRRQVRPSACHKWEILWCIEYQQAVASLAIYIVSPKQEN